MIRDSEGWCLILGASSGFGAAAARAFAAAGYDVFGVHLDRKSTLANAEAVAKDVAACGRRVQLVNANAVDPEQRSAALATLRELVGEGRRVRVLMHSLAFGTLRPLVPLSDPLKAERVPGVSCGPQGAERPRTAAEARDVRQAVSPAQMAMTLDVMASSLVDWTQALVAADLLEDGGRIFAMTSEGSKRSLPAYGPVAAAKAALEALVRQLAVELGPREIAVNAICAGVTRTPAAEKIPGSAAMLENALRRHPRGRLTLPEDVAGVLVALSKPECAWLTGNVIQVDGGEGLVP